MPCFLLCSEALRGKQGICGRREVCYLIAITPHLQRSGVYRCRAFLSLFQGVGSMRGNRGLDVHGLHLMRYTMTKDPTMDQTIFSQP